MKRLYILLAAIAATGMCTTLHAEGGTAADTIVVCASETLVLSSSYNDAEYYLWTSSDPAVNGATTQSVEISKGLLGVYEYKVVATKSTLVAENNLMANGDFETIEGSIGSKTPAPTTFGSDYTFAGWDVAQGEGEYPNYYVITSNAKRYLDHAEWGFYDLAPHGGKYYALFDAGKKGFAWYATSSKKNSTLKFEKDSTYIFSYWVAEPNKKDYPTAKLQFVVQYRDENGLTQEVLLGDEYDTKNAKNKWEYQEVTWTAPATSNDVLIGVRDNVDSEEGNDFCLDDIMFQTMSYNNTTVLFTDSFTVKVNAGIYRKWDDFLFVDNADGTCFTYQWYVNGQPIEGATEQYYRIPGEVNDTDDYYCIVNAGTDTEVELCHTTFAYAKPSNEIHPYQGPKQEVARRTYQLSPQIRLLVVTFDDGTCETTKQLKTN